MDIEGSFVFHPLFLTILNQLEGQKLCFFHQMSVEKAFFSI